jgi:hypothetical protein
MMLGEDTNTCLKRIILASTNLVRAVKKSSTRGAGKRLQEVIGVLERQK